MFTKYDKNGKSLRYKDAVLDCSGDESITEQSHKAESDINNIIKRHGIDMIAATNHLLSSTFVFDDLPNNDFQEAMNIVIRAQGEFNKLPSGIRKQFDNDPATFLDFIHNPDNGDKLVEMGLANAPVIDKPIEVFVTNPVSETPPE